MCGIYLISVLISPSCSLGNFLYILPVGERKVQWPSRPSLNVTSSPFIRHNKNVNVPSTWYLWEK